MNVIPDYRGALDRMAAHLKPDGFIFLADFKPPTNPILAHVALVLVGHKMMMQSNVGGIPPMLMEAGFVDVASRPTRSAFLAFVSGKKTKKLIT